MSDSLREKVTEALFWMKRSDADFDSARETIVTLVEAYARKVTISELEKLTIPFGIELHPFYAEDRNAEQRFGYAEARVTFLKAKEEAINRLKGEL